VLDKLAEVEMHAIQTSGNCIRNTTTDHFAGAAQDEVLDPRAWCEIIRQWSTFHPEFSYLPRKFKIAVTGAAKDRAAIQFHDIGVQIVKGADGAAAFDIYVGGGQGRTPMVAHRIGAAIPAADLIAYLEAVMRVYNMYGRRDNIYKARIKILVHQIGAEEMRRQVEAEFAEIKTRGELGLPAEEIARIKAYFSPPAFDALPADAPDTDKFARATPAFAAWRATNVHPHRQPGYVSVTISLKPIGGIPGDASSDQMDAVADLADRFSFGEIRVTHEQNLVFAHVRLPDLPALWQGLKAHDLHTANAGLITDIIACPGLDYCDLANARSIPVAQRISEHFADLDAQHRIGELKIKISGCINACGHHHAGHIGILGVDKKGVEFFQITIGGSGDETASIGEVLGPAFGEAETPGAISNLVETYLSLRQPGERFLDTTRRVGLQPFRERLYGAH
jgi:sulfite reductase (NADPH) hemoprotein beta-component